MYKCCFYTVHQGVKIGTNSIFCRNDLKNIVQDFKICTKFYIFKEYEVLHVYVPS